MHPALVMFIPMAAQCQWNPATNTSSTLFLYARATAETSRFYDIQATSVATCCVAHVSLVFGDWIHQKSNNPYMLGANHDMTDMYIMVRVIHPVLGIHFSCVWWTPLFMDWWLFSNTGNHPMFWPRIQTIRDQTPDPFERVPHSCPDLGVAKLRCESWAKLIFPNFSQLDMREPTVFLAPWATVSYLWLHWPLSSPRNEWKSRMLIANAEIIHKDQCDPNIFIIFT